MTGAGAPGSGLGRFLPAAAGLILSSGLVIVCAALVLTLGSDPGKAPRRAVTVQQLPAVFHGPSALVGALNGRSARARALARTDLDADGATDLVVGYAWRGAGIVTVQRGNSDAFAPKRRAVFERMQRGFDPARVVADARAVRVPEPISYAEAGDFNHDDRPDVLVAAHGGGLYLLAGDGHGRLGPAERIPLPGPVTTVTAGEFRGADGHQDVAVGVVAPKGPELLLYDDAAGGKPAEPMRFRLPGTATAVRFGSLDSDPYMDLAVAAGGQIAIVHGWGRKRSPALASRVERLGEVSSVRGISIGYFMRDREGRNEIAVAFSDGTVRLLIPKDLDTRPVTGKTRRARAAARLRATRVRRGAESLPGWRASKASGWRVGRRIARGAAGVLPQNLLTSAKVSLLDTDDLLVARGADGLDLVRAGDSDSTASRTVASALTELNAAVDAPAAVLPMPVKSNGSRGILAVGDDGAAPTIVELAASTIAADRFDDPSGAALTAASACTAAANDCSLRGAVQFANNPANAPTTINLPAGTYTLSINGNGGCLAGGESNAVGDLELNQSTTITGAGAASTIIRQTGTGTANNGDRVMCLNANFLVGLQYTFSGVTITGGREPTTIGGGGIIGGELSNSLTLSAVVVSNNQDGGSGLGGGGVQITGGDLTITNSLFGGSSAPGADRNNVNLANSVGTSGGGVMYTPSSPMHAGGTGVLTVSGSTFINNTSGGIGGGGLDLVTFAFASPGGIGSGSANINTSSFTNNQAANTGGGIVVESLATTVATSTFTSNSAGNRGGGIYVGGASLTLDGTSPSLMFTGNTATNAGSTISTASAVTVLGTNVALGGDIEMSLGGSWTNSAGSVISPTNVVIAGGTFNANNSTTNMSGNLTFSSGTFNSGTGVFNFNGAGAQSITGPASPTFNTLQVNKTGGSTLTLGVNAPIKSDLTVGSGTLDLGAFTANRTVAGGTLTVSNGAMLRIGGTNGLPTAYLTYALGPTSTVEYAGSGAQTITATSYGNLTSSSTGARTLPSGQTVSVAGAFTPGTNAYTVTGSTVAFNGAGAQTIPAFGYNHLSSSSTGGRTLAAAGTVGVAGAFTPGTNAYTVTGSTVSFNGAGAQTIPAFGYNHLSSSSTGGRTLAAAGTVGVAGAFTPGTNAYTVTGSTVDFNGAGAQTIPAFGYNNLTSSSTGSRTLAAAGTVGVAGAFTPGTNAYTVTGSTVAFNGAGAQTIPAFGYNNLSSSSTGGRTLAASGTIGVAGTFTPGTNAYTVTGSTVDFNGAGAQTIPAFGYNHLSSSSTGGRTLAAAGTVGVAGAFTPGTNAYTVTGSTVSFNGAGAQTIPAFGYNHLSSSSTGGRTLAAAGTVGVAGAFTPGTNAYTVTGSTVSFNGAGAQTIPAFGYNHLSSSSTGGRTLAAAGTVGVAGAFTPGTNAYTVTGSTVDFNGAGAQTIPAFGYNNLTSSSTGSRTLAAAGTVGVAGAFTPGTNAYTVTGSTVAFNGAGAQTIPAFGYNNLSSSSTGGRTLAASGTIGVAGTFTPGTNAYTVTGSTVDFNGAGAQTISAFAYNNLTSSSTGPRTLPSGQTVSVARAFTPGTNAYTVTGSTVAFNGAGAQTIPAFGYNNLSSSSTGARTLAAAGTVGVAGAFTPGTNAYTVTGSTVSFNGAGAQTIPAFTFNNLTDANTAATVSLTASTTVNGALTVNANAVLDTATFILTVNGAYTNNGQIRHSHSQVLSATPGPFNSVDGLGEETVRLSGLSAAFGSTATNTAAAGANPYNACGALPPNAVRRFWQVTPTVSGSGVARFSFRTDEMAGGVPTDRLAIYRCVSGGGAWTEVGTAYTRPAPAGPVPGYSSVEATGVPFVSTGATYVVAEGTSDLTVLKTNNAGGPIAVGSAWTWTLHVANGGSGNATFAGGQTIVLDNLPNSAVSYGSVSVAGIGSGVTGGASIACSIVSSDLTCTASGGAVTLGPANGSFDVVFTATPTSAVTYANPRAAGSCSVDPGNTNAESDEGNNGCSDSVTVAKANTVTTITSDDPDPSGIGQPASVDFTVVAPGGGTPTGSVTVSAGADSCTATVATGTCDIVLTTTVGSRPLTAVYAGDTNFNGSTSAQVAHTVEKIATTTSITSDAPDPSNVGDVVTVAYSVAPGSGGGTPTGDVTVSDGVDTCTATVAAGACDITLTTAGSRPLAAAYAGDATFKDSTSASEPHTVNGTPTTTTIVSDGPDPSVVGQAVTVRYTVVSGVGTPTGNVTVSDGTRSCTATVAAGQCTFVPTSAGASSLTATYAGAGTFNGSLSAVASHTVNRAGTTTAITADRPDPSTPGAPVTVDYRVGVVAPGAGAPGGTVTVSDGVNRCAATVAAGRCTLALTRAGARTLTASYAGDSRFRGSSSSGQAHAVDSPPPALAQISDAGLTNRRFRVSRRPRLAQAGARRPPVGTTFRYTLDRAAPVTFRFIQPGLGRKVNGRCAARTKRNASRPRCTLRRGSLKFAGNAGVNTVRFKGWLSRTKKLTPGKYTLVIRATTPGVGSTTLRLRFTVMR